MVKTLRIMARWPWNLSWGAGVLAAGACLQVAGIEDAEEDPTFRSGAANSGTSAQGASGGSGGFKAHDTAASGGSGLAYTAGSSGHQSYEGGAAAGGSNGGSNGGSSLCDEYCTTVMANCTGEHAVYQSLPTCQGVCAELAPGSRDDRSGNTVGCRLRNAINAKDLAEPADHCPVAGPGGFGVCGSDCESYCLLFSKICDAAFGQKFEDAVACQLECGTLPSLGPFDQSQSSGENLNCRLWHVSAASVEPGPHCPHASGEGPCGPPEG